MAEDNIGNTQGVSSSGSDPYSFYRMVIFGALAVLIAAAGIYYFVYRDGTPGGQEGQGEKPKTLTELIQQSQAPENDEFFSAVGEDYPLDARAVITGISYDETEETAELDGFDYVTPENKESVFSRWRQYGAERSWQVVSEQANSLNFSAVDGGQVVLTVTEEAETGVVVEIEFR
jgi:hypothetical protein